MLSMAVPTLVNGKPKNGAWSPDAITEIHPDGSITFTLTKHEMGQGTGTGIPMIFCDELGADWNRLKVVQADFNSEKYGGLQGNTGGSSGVRLMWNPVRRLAATTRETLKEAAARKWNVDRSILTADNGFVIDATSNQKIGFEELISEVSGIEIPEEEVKFKDRKDYKIIGTSQKNLITPGVVRGEKLFAGDLQIPGMVFAAIERCPVYQGKVSSYDDTETRKIKGVVDVIEVPEFFEGEQFIVRNGVAVIATSTWAAFEGKKALKVQWDEGANGTMNNDKLRKELKQNAAEPGTAIGGGHGDIEAAEAGADEVVSNTYENAYHAHACMEPLNAIAHVTDDKAEIWAPMQSPNNVSARMVSHLNIPESKQTIHVLNSGGSFGRKYYPDYTTEAAYLSKQISKPVKLTWTREDDIRCDYNSNFQHDIHSVAIKNGKVDSWDIKILETDRYSPNPWLPYYVPNKRSTAIHRDSPLSIGAWRSVGPHRAAFGTECTMDEVAVALNKDPLDLRLEMLELPDEIPQDSMGLYNHEQSVLSRKYMKAVLKDVARRSDWGKKMPAGTGQGLAAYKFSYTGSYCAHVVEVDTRGDELKVTRVTSSLYCGTVVNPHFVKGQIEGSIIWSLTSALYGGMDFENGRVKQSNFHDYKMLRMHETPEMDVDFVLNEGDAHGTGEPGVPPFTPALMNAIFAATGKRIRHTPIRKEDWA